MRLKGPKRRNDVKETNTAPPSLFWFDQNGCLVGLNRDEIILYLKDLTLHGFGETKLPFLINCLEDTYYSFDGRLSKSAKDQQKTKDQWSLVSHFDLQALSKIGISS